MIIFKKFLILIPLSHGTNGEMCVEYTHEILRATDFIRLPEDEKLTLAKKFLGTVIKLLYAFVWQEGGYFPNIGAPTFSPEGNEKGWELLPILNDMVNSELLGTDSLNDYFNPDLQFGIGIYPGELWCNPGLYPHAKWHLQTGIALVDLTNLMDEVLKIIIQWQTNPPPTEPTTTPPAVTTTTTPATTSYWNHSWDGETRRMLDGMQQLMTSEDTYFDQSLFQNLYDCFMEIDEDLIAVTEANWYGIYSYAQTDGNPGTDDWLPCSEMVDEDRWFEFNCTTQEYGKIPIYEPCYYSSNLAYYQTAIEICKRKDTGHWGPWTFDDNQGKINFLRSTLKSNESQNLS